MSCASSPAAMAVPTTPLFESALREARLFYTRSASERLELAVARLLLARAGRRMIGQKQLEQSAACALNFLGVGDDLHARLDRPDARGRENTRARVHNAEAADADGRFVLKVAQSGNGDSLHARGVKDAGAGR